MHVGLSHARPIPSASASCNQSYRNAHRSARKSLFGYLNVVDSRDGCMFQLIYAPELHPPERYVPTYLLRSTYVRGCHRASQSNPSQADSDIVHDLLQLHFPSSHRRHGLAEPAPVSCATHAFPRSRMPITRADFPWVQREPRGYARRSTLFL